VNNVLLSAGLLITEATAINEEAGNGWPNTSHIRTHANVKGWEKVDDRVQTLMLKNAFKTTGL
jgi:2,4-dienoyl-CoA reductase-like NADH-dependent reductase (Old Yellow Enzyme family)